MMGIFYNHVDPEVEDKADEEYAEWFKKTMDNIHDFEERSRKSRLMVGSKKIK